MMEVENVVHVKNLRICRLCLTESASLNNIFHDDSNLGIVVWKTLEDLIHIKVSREDGFPETICEKCLCKVMEFDSFKQECIKSTMTLLNIVANKGVVEGQPQFSSSTSNGGINFIRVSSTPFEYMNAEDTLNNQDKDPLDVRSYGEEQSFDQEAVSLGNKRDLHEISSRVCAGNTSMDRFLEARICSPRIHESVDESQILHCQVKNDDINVGSSLNSGDEMLPIKIEPDSQVVPTGYSSDTLLESLENPISEELRTSNLYLSKEETLGEPSDTKSSLYTFCNEDHGLSCPPAFLPIADLNPVGRALVEEDNSSEREIKPKKVSEFDHQSCAMPQQMLPMPIPFLRVQSIDTCSSTSSKYPSQSCCDRTESSQYPSDISVQEEPELGNGSNSIAQHPVDDHVSSCARFMSIPIHLKSCTKSKASGDLHSAYKHLDTKGSSLPTTPGQLNCTVRNDHEGSTECSPNPIRIVRERLQRAAKQRNCSEKKSSSSEGFKPDSEVGTFICISCRKVYRNKYFLGQHIRKVHQKVVSESQPVEGQSDRERESYPQSGNSPTSKKLANRARHEGKHSTREMSSQKLVKYVISKQPDGLYHCFDCKKIFQYRHRFRLHLDVVHKGLKKQHKCDICGTCVTRKDDLESHRKRMHGEWVPYPCRMCTAVFGSRKSLGDHERRMHGLRAKPGSTIWECNICKKLFRRNDNLSRHMAVHQKHRDFVCEECGMTFREERCMKMHQRRKHQLIRPHQCGHCNKLFFSKFEVQSHVKVHLQE